MDMHDNTPPLKNILFFAGILGILYSSLVMFLLPEPYDILFMIISSPVLGWNTLKIYNKVFGEK